MITFADDHDAFLRRIRLDPDDDTPRLIFADWLQDRDGDVECRACIGGQSIVTAFEKCFRCKGTDRTPNGYADRAEFIRVQCELTNWTPPYSPWCPVCGWVFESCSTEDHKKRWPKEQLRYEELRRRERELDGVRVRLDVFPPNHSPDLPPSYHWARGFAESVTCGWNWWVVYWRDVQAHPDAVIREVRLADWPDEEWLEREDEEYRDEMDGRVPQLAGLIARRPSRVRKLLNRRFKSNLGDPPGSILIRFVLPES